MTNRPPRGTEGPAPPPTGGGGAEGGASRGDGLSEPRIRALLGGPGVPEVAAAVQAAGGRAWLVGGAVRDAALGLAAKDVDIEVHGLQPAQVEAALRPLGPLKAVGRSFGVFKLRLAGAELDVALPRGRSPAGEVGEVVAEPFLGIEGACRRRDLSVNAIAVDAQTGEIADPVGGLLDLAAGRLRAADPSTFGDDPLRALRAARFAATLGLRPTADLSAICAAQDLREVPGERIGAELLRLLAGPWAPAGLELALRWGSLRGALPPLPADDEAALLRALAHAPRACRALSPAAADAARLALLLHGLPPQAAADALDRLRVHSRDGYPVQRVALHASAGGADLAITPVALRTAAEHGHAAVCIAVRWALRPDFDLDDALGLAAALGVLHGPLPPLLRGRDLVALGVPTGPALGELQARLRAAQLAGEIEDAAQATALAVRLWSARPPETR